MLHYVGEIVLEHKMILGCARMKGNKEIQLCYGMHTAFH